MAFISPIFLYALPLCLLPLLWHLIVKRETRREKAASLYFIEKIYGTRSRKLLFSHWLELILEILFIFFLVLSFAKPYFTNVGQKPGDVYLVLDNSPSSYDVLKKEIVSEKLMDNFWSQLPVNTRVFFFDFSMIIKGESPIAVANKTELLDAFLIHTLIERKPVNMSMLDAYFSSWLKETSSPSKLLLISDLKKNHFNRHSSIRHLKIYYYDIDTKRDNVNFAISVPADTLLFVGETIELVLNIQTSKANRSVTVEVLENKESIFLEEVKIKTKREKIFLPIRFDTAGYHHLLVKMTYKNKVIKKEIVQEDVITLFIVPSFEIYLQSSSETFFLFEKMFSLDLEQGNITLSQKREVNADKSSHLAIVTDYDISENLSWLRGIPTVLFVPGEINMRSIKDLLESHFSMEIVLPYRVTPYSFDSSSSISQTKPFPNPFDLLHNLTRVDEIPLANEIAFQTSMTTIRRRNEGNFLTLAKQLVLYGFDVESKDTYFLQSAVGLGFIYQSLLYLFRPLGVKHGFNQDDFNETVLIPMVVTENDFFNQVGGVYSNKKAFFNVHPRLDEWNAEQIDMKDIFNRSIKIDETSIGQIKADYLLWQWLLALAMLCLGVIGGLFYFRTRLI